MNLSIHTRSRFHWLMKFNLSWINLLILFLCISNSMDAQTSSPGLRIDVSGANEEGILGLPYS